MIFFSVTGCGAGRSVAFLADAHPSGLAQGNNSLPGEIKPEDYLALSDHARNVDGFLCALHGAASRLWNVLSSAATGRVEHGISRLTAAGFWTALVSFLVLMAAFFVPGGASGAGWTQYPPLSALASAGPGQGLGTDLWLVSIGLFCLSSLMSAVGFVATTVRHRGSGNDMAAHAANLLELVRHGDSHPAGFRNPAGCGGPADA